MKFKRPTRSGFGSSSESKNVAATETKQPLVNLKTIDKKAKKSNKSGLMRGFKQDEEEKENRLKTRWLGHPSTSSSSQPPTNSKHPEDVLSERLAKGLNLWSRPAGADEGEQEEAKPIPKPVLSFMGPQNYFKRSFSMRVRSTQGATAATEVETATVELKTATIRRAFGKSLTSKERGTIYSLIYTFLLPLSTKGTSVKVSIQRKSCFLIPLLFAGILGQFVDARPKCLLS